MAEKRINKFKIFSITGYTDSEHINYIKSSGSDYFYNKPISANMIEDLLLKAEIIKKWVGLEEGSINYYRNTIKS